VNRDLKHTVDIRPVHHRREDRIRAHVLLCWLALLLIRVIENDSRADVASAQETLPAIDGGAARHQARPRERDERLTSEQKRVLDALRVKPPARFPNVPTAANL
jgi:hypothetical protein